MIKSFKEDIIILEIKLQRFENGKMTHLDWFSIVSLNIWVIKKRITNTKEFDIEMIIKVRFAHQKADKCNYISKNLLMSQLVHISDN